MVSMIEYLSVATLLILTDKVFDISFYLVNMMCPAVGGIMAPKDVYILISGTCECYLRWQNGFC